MSNIHIKSQADIEKMRIGGGKLAHVLELVWPKIVPGVSTLELDSFIEKQILASGGELSFTKVRDYRFASCIGLNSEVVHSLPSATKIIQAGDLVKVDIGLFYQGLHTDLSWTKAIQTHQYDTFLAVGRQALASAISQAVVGNRIGHLSQAIGAIVQGAGYAPTEILTGHGIGKKLHEQPMIPCLLQTSLEKTALLEPGLTIAIEVIYNEKTPDLVLENDGWTISTKDGRISALFENTIAVTENGPLILTPITGLGN